MPTSFIYGVDDWMNYEGAVEARKKMNVPCDIIRVPKVCSPVFFRILLDLFRVKNHNIYVTDGIPM